jgi:hypothetical protein
MPSMDTPPTLPPYGLAVAGEHVPVRRRGETAPERLAAQT